MQAVVESGRDRLTVNSLAAATDASAQLMLREFLRAHGLRAPSSDRLDEMLHQVTHAAPGAAVAFEHDGAVLRRFRGELAVVPIALPQGEVVLHRCRGAGIDAAKLADNVRAFIDHIVSMQPNSVRGQYVKSISISATMTPGVMVAA